MLRIGNPKPPEQGQPPMPPGGMPPGPPPPELMAQMEAMGKPQAPKPSKFSADKANPKIVVYMDSSMGPFQCSNCMHFEEDGSCSVVAGPIDPGGICHVFTPAGAPPPPDEGGEEVPPGPSGAAPPTEDEVNEEV